MTALELEPQEVPSLVNADHPRSLPRLDRISWAHEAQHIAHVVARRAALLLPRQVLLTMTCTLMLGAAGFGGGQDRLAQPLIALAPDHVEAFGRDPRAVDEKGEGRACFHGAVLLTVTHEHDLRPHFLGPVKQLPRLTARQEACFVQDPELRLSAGREGLLERRGDRDAINGGFLQDGRCRRRGREAAYLPTRLFGMLADEGQGPGLAGPCFALDGNEPIRTGEDVPRGAQLILAQATRRLG